MLRGFHFCLLYPGSQVKCACTCACACIARVNKQVNSISISGMLTLSHLLGQKVKPRWLPMRGNFVGQFQSSSRSCTSVPVLYTPSVISFCLVWLQNIPDYGKSVQDEILLDQFYIIEHSKGFKNAMWPKKCAKLSKHGKLGLILSK